MTRVLLWYEANGGAAIRLTERLALDLGTVYGKNNIGLLVNRDNPYAGHARFRGNKVYLSVAKSGLAAPVSIIANFPARLRRFASILREFEPDVVVIVMNFALSWPLLRRIDRNRTTLVYFVHDPEPHSGDFAPLWQRTSQALTLRAVDKIVALSDYGREVTANQRCAAGKDVSVVPLLAIGEPRAEAERTASHAMPYRFLFLGRLISYKGLDLLAEACDLFSSRDDWSLTVAGVGPASDQVRALAKRIPQVKADYVRWLLDEEIDMLIDTHDMLVCPYRDASQSGVVAEALAAGMPAIVTPVGGLPEQVDFGRCGIVTTDVSAPSIAAAMAAAIDARHSYSEMSGAASRFAKASHDAVDWQAILSTRGAN